MAAYEFEQTLGDSEGQGSLACCSPWGLQESDMTQQLNNKIEKGHSIVLRNSASITNLLQVFIINGYQLLSEAFSVSKMIL